MPPKTLVRKKTARRPSAGRPRAARGPKAAKRAAVWVRRAVVGTLNREVEVEVARWVSSAAEPARWAVTMLCGEQRSPAIYLKEWELDAMRQVPLVPAHLRGHFLRNYVQMSARAGRPADRHV